MTMNLVWAILLTLFLAPATAYLRWQFGKTHWSAYPGGSKGHFLDCLNASVPLFPICAGALSYSLLPPGQTQNVVAFGLIGMGLLYGFTPSARRANLRLVQARFDGKPQ
ncbi:MAG: hypothetical protein JWM33_3914 [Caulobacteraceae bacterium]|nr:hypothetical protein [Caulobacteraceae bacterium]